MKGQRPLFAPLEKSGRGYMLRTIFSPDEPQLQKITIPTGGGPYPSLPQPGSIGKAEPGKFYRRAAWPFSAVSGDSFKLLIPESGFVTTVNKMTEKTWNS